MKKIFLDKAQTARIIYVASVNANYMMNIYGRKYRIGSLQITITENGSILEYDDTLLSDMAATDLMEG